LRKFASAVFRGTNDLIIHPESGAIGVRIKVLPITAKKVLRLSRRRWIRDIDCVGLLVDVRLCVIKKGKYRF
jgi:hypothetical protein